MAIMYSTYRLSHGRMLPVWNHLWHEEHMGRYRAVCPSSARLLVLFLVQLWTTSSSAPCAEIMVHLRMWKRYAGPFQINHYFSLNTMILPLPQRRKKWVLYIYLERKEVCKSSAPSSGFRPWGGTFAALSWGGLGVCFLLVCCVVISIIVNPSPRLSMCLN